MDLKEAAELVEQYKTTKWKDVYSRWCMDKDAWKRPYVKDVFRELKDFIDTTLTSSAGSARSCYEYDLAVLDIVDRHMRRDEAADVGHLQAVFVALIMDALEAKHTDDRARRQHNLLTHGYKSQLLSFLVAQLLRETMIGPLLALYKDERSRKLVLGFFELL